MPTFQMARGNILFNHVDLSDVAINRVINRVVSPHNNLSFKNSFLFLPVYDSIWNLVFVT